MMKSDQYLNQLFVTTKNKTVPGLYWCKWFFYWSSSNTRL